MKPQPNSKNLPLITRTLCLSLLLSGCTSTPRKTTTKTKPQPPQELVSQNPVPPPKTITKERMEEIQKYIPPHVTLVQPALLFAPANSTPPPYKNIPAGSVVNVASVAGQDIHIEYNGYSGKVPLLATDFLERVLEEAYR